MKTCALCGASSADDAATCHACGEGTFVPKLSPSEFVSKLASGEVSEADIILEPIKPANYSMSRKGKR